MGNFYGCNPLGGPSGVSLRDNIKHDATRQGWHCQMSKWIPDCQNYSFPAHSWLKMLCRVSLAKTKWSG